MQRLLGPRFWFPSVDFSSGGANGKASLNFPTPEPQTPTFWFLFFVEHHDNPPVRRCWWKLTRSIPRLRDRIRAFETLEQTEKTLEPRHDPRLFLAGEPSTRKFPDFDKTNTVSSASMWTFWSIFIKRPTILSLNKLIRNDTWFFSVCRTRKRTFRHTIYLQTINWCY